MRIKFKFLFLLPLLISTPGCSSSKKIYFQESGFTLATYYEDSFFATDNSVVSPDIALASHAMALATFNGDEDYTKRSRYLRDLWVKEGFERIRMSESFYEKPGTDTIAYGLASKDIQLLGGKYTLIACAIRGGNYEGEWTSNITIGATGNATGFDQASDQVIEGLKNYLHDYEITGHVRFWISGFSRAAITSNMTAGKILDKMVEREYLTPNVNYDKRDIYAYCFEPPLGVDSSRVDATAPLYQGIHNFLNFNDLVPFVAPSEWGFTRYGTDHYYSDRLTDIYFDETEREKMISYYHFTYGADKFAKYTVDDWKFFNVGEEVTEANNLPVESVNPSLGRFCRNFITELATEGFRDRDTYATYIEGPIRELFKAVLGFNEEIEPINLSNAVNIIFQYSFIQSLMHELIDSNTPSDFAYDVQPLFLELFGANDDNYYAIADLYGRCFSFLLLFANTFNKHQDLAGQLLYRDNAMGLIIGHMPELSYSFLSTINPRIMGKNATKLNDGCYQVLHIENAQEFAIYEKNLNKVIFTYKDNVMESSRVSAEKFADGTIDLYLPNNGDYEYIGHIGKATLTKIDRYNRTTLLNANVQFSRV